MLDRFILKQNCCQNFTIYNTGTNHASWYWLSETESSICSSIFISCLSEYLERHCVQAKLPIIIFSDDCTFQNRNSTMTNATLEARKKPAPYDTYFPDYSFFKDYSKHLKYQSIRPGRRTVDPTVTDSRVLEYSPVF